MAAPKFIEIDGKRIAWRDVLQRRREQIEACAEPGQPALFELREDHRPASDAPPPAATSSLPSSRRFCMGRADP